MKSNLAYLQPQGSSGKPPAPRAATRPSGCEADFFDAAQHRRQRLFDGLRWGGALLIILLLCTGGIAWWRWSPAAPASATPPAAAMVIELAPAPVAPASTPDMPPSPQETQDAPPPKPDPKPEPEPEPEITSAPKPDAVIPQTEPVEEEPEEEKQDEPESTASAPPQAQQEDDKAAAPNLGVTASVAQANRVPRWRDALLLALNDAKRYPSSARRRRQEGVAHLQFRMDREGKVLSATLVKSTGHRSLDEETLDLIRRAEPLPKPPAKVEGETLEFVVPVEFFLKW